MLVLIWIAGTACLDTLFAERYRFIWLLPVLDTIWLYLILLPASPTTKKPVTSAPTTFASTSTVSTPSTTPTIPQTTPTRPSTTLTPTSQSTSPLPTSKSTSQAPAMTSPLTVPQTTRPPGVCPPMRCVYPCDAGVSLGTDNCPVCKCRSVNTTASP